jgi:hypothetical protein
MSKPAQPTAAGQAAGTSPATLSEIRSRLMEVATLLEMEADSAHFWWRNVGQLTEEADQARGVAADAPPGGIPASVQSFLTDAGAALPHVERGTQQMEETLRAIADVVRTNIRSLTSFCGEVRA